MNITQVIIASIIFGLINSMTITWGFFYVNTMEDRKEHIFYSELKRNIIDFYNINGRLPSDLNEIKIDKNINTVLENKDRYGNQYYYSIQNFSYENINDGIAFVSSKGANNKFDSQINLGTLIPSEKETFLIISNTDLLYGDRWQTKNKVNICNSALSMYKALNPTAENITMSNLVASSFIDGKNSYDNWGNIIQIENDANCFSVGFNKVNDNGLDDVR
ncbi:MAG: hypothetical protein JHC31_05885 [Sulfurihydrogenibium sp.]|jgi:hypothetical protein|nr:hypothetical protein [Sulfurihydrogenibium sp.]